MNEFRPFPCVFDNKRAQRRFDKLQKRARAFRGVSYLLGYLQIDCDKEIITVKCTIWSCDREAIVEKIIEMHGAMNNGRELEWTRTNTTAVAGDQVWTIHRFIDGEPVPEFPLPGTSDFDAEQIEIEGKIASKTFASLKQRYPLTGE